MSTGIEPKSARLSEKQLDELIDKAIRKVGGCKESDICRYLPVPNGGYMHHFTLRKMKTQSPKELGQMVNQFIMEVEEPVSVAPKPRAARGSRKRRGQITFNKNDLERMLNIARIAGDKEMVAKLTPKKSLAAIKRDLIASIRQGKVEADLWEAYAESVGAQQATLDMEAGIEASVESFSQVSSPFAFPPVE